MANPPRSRSTLIERPVLCVGAPGRFPSEGFFDCDTEATHAVTQIRPDQFQQPQLVIMGVCPKHRKSVESWAKLTFPDPEFAPQTMTLDYLEYYFLPEWESHGAVRDTRPSHGNWVPVTSQGVG